MFAAVAVFFVVQLSPERVWIYGFIGYSIPFLLIIHFLFFFYWLFKRSWKIILPMIVFWAGWDHVRSSVQWSFTDQNIENGFKVINYNVRNFIVFGQEKPSHKSAASSELLDWLSQQEADVLCFQEYYNDKNSKIYNIEKSIEAKGFDNVFRFRGLATYSKFPIINSGSIDYPHPGDNKTIFVDLVIHHDTIRVFNFHFYSMKMKMYGFREESTLWKDTFYRIRQGFQAHAREVDILKEHILNSPYPVILAGDLNELPYGYTYVSFREVLNNSFEEKGRGFGFTYGHRPSFIRIDNQFSSPVFEVKSHKVHNEIRYSDHFPVSVVYELDNENDL